MEFKKICPVCLKSYVNGAVGKCKKCKVELKRIKHDLTLIKNNIVEFYYKIEK